MIPFFRDSNEWFIKKYVNVGRPPTYRTFLHSEATKTYAASRIEYLLSLGANIDARDYKFQTPLHRAASIENGPIKVFLKNGADVNARDEDGKTPLHHYARRGNVRGVRLFLESNSDIHTMDYQGETPLFSAVRSENIEVMQLFMDLGGDVENENIEDGSKPVHLVDEFYKLETMKCLLKHGANIHALDYRGRTPLLRMLDSQSYSWVLSKKLRFLLKHSNVNVIDSKERNALSVTSNVHFWKPLLEHIGKLRALDLPIHAGILESIEREEKYKEYFKKCTDELEIAKNTKLDDTLFLKRMHRSEGESKVSFLNLLVDSKKKLKNYVGSRDFIDYEKVNWLLKYPIYGSSMYDNVLGAVTKKEIFDESAVMLRSCLPIFNSHDDIVVDILNCIKSSKDLEKFCVEGDLM